jgi:hypothetical protein
MQNLGHNIIDVTNQSIFKIAKNCPLIKKLILSGNDNTKKAIEEISEILYI